MKWSRAVLFFFWGGLVVFAIAVSGCSGGGEDTTVLDEPEKAAYIDEELDNIKEVHQKGFPEEVPLPGGTALEFSGSSVKLKTESSLEESYNYYLNVYEEDGWNIQEIDRYPDEENKKYFDAYKNTLLVEVILQEEDTGSTSITVRECPT